MFGNIDGRLIKRGMVRNAELYIVYTDECWQLASVVTRTEEFYKRCFGRKKTLL